MAFSCTILFGVVWKTDSSVGKSKICLLPLGFRGMHEAAIPTTAKCRAAESEAPAVALS